MAKFITKFDTVNAYNEAAPKFDLPHVSLTKDNNILHYHPISSLAVGTYLYNDGTTGTTPNSNVVGICVIPDGLLPDRKARFMSVKAITTETTENDIINEINWADNTRTLLPKQYTEVPCVGLNEDSGTVVITNQVEHSHEDGHMPSDSRDFTGLTDPYDITTMFSYDAYEHYIPSPFMNNRAFNENYSTLFTTGGTAIDNALSDFDGFRNTQILIKDGDVVAAKQCAEFKPGYRDGEWYLPAVGELGFIIPSFMAINIYLATLDSIADRLDDDNYGSNYWSSTEYNGSLAWAVNTIDGSVYPTGKPCRYNVRAFLTL